MKESHSSRNNNDGKLGQYVDVCRLQKLYQTVLFLEPKPLRSGSRFLDSNAKCCAAPGGLYASATEAETVVEQYERNLTRDRPRANSVAYFNNLVAARLSLKRYKSRRGVPWSGVQPGFPLKT